jgi:ABC-type transporter Mla MlaB component
MAAPRPTPTACTIRGPLARSDLGGLAARLRTAIGASRAQVAVCDLDTGVAVDLVAVEALARLQLQARRLGCSVRLGSSPSGLVELLELLGLDAVLGVDARREVEERKELFGVEEERDLRDPPG